MNTDEKKDQFNRLDVIDAVRALASISVAWAHIVNNTNPLQFADQRLYGAVKFTARYGYLGVYIFFVVSGFVIPLSLIKVEYSVSEFPRFMLKRLVRLQPPYYASILLSLLAAYAAAHAPNFQGEAPHFTVSQVLMHLAYLPPFFGQSWIDVVYWSLLVEVEYYVLIGLVMAFLRQASSAWIACTLCVACFAPVILPNPSHLPYHLPFFVIGAALCFARAQKLDTRMTSIILLVALAAITMQHDLPYIICAVITIALLQPFASVPTVFLFLGRISYSLYLVHYVVGIKMVHLLGRYANTDFARAAIYVVALSTSIFAAWIFYRLFERPALAWSSRIKLARISAEMRADIAIAEVAP